MAINHPEGRELPDDHPLKPGAPMRIMSLRGLVPSTTSTEKSSTDSSEKSEKNPQPKPAPKRSPK